MPPVLAKALRLLVTGVAPWPLFLHGRPGTGKTCAGLALCDHVRRSEYVTAADLTSEVIESFKRKEAFCWDKYRPLKVVAREDQEGYERGRKGCHLLVLDELGVRANVTDTHYEAVQRVLDMREGHPLVVISNHGIAEIARLYDARIASRCEAGTVVEVSGPDRRTA